MVIEKTTLSFLENLNKNNNREWFHDNKQQFQKAQANIKEIVTYLSEQLATEISITGLTPQYKLFRIYRDLRFSKNKNPYKTNFGAVLGNDGKTESASFYLHIAPNNQSFIGGGIYKPCPKRLAQIRLKIIKQFSHLEAILKDKQFTKYYSLNGDKLKTMPKGYSKYHPAANYLKYKDLLGIYKINDNNIIKSNFLKNAFKAFEALAPLNNFLNEA